MSIVARFTSWGWSRKMRWTLMLMALMVGVLAAQAPRPWMQGTVEKGCGRSPAAIAQLKKDKPDVVIEKCECRHSCDPNDEHAMETDERKWDGACQARCSPDNCRCPHPCDS